MLRAPRFAAITLRFHVADAAASFTHSAPMHRLPAPPLLLSPPFSFSPLLMLRHAAADAAFFAA